MASDTEMVSQDETVSNSKDQISQNGATISYDKMNGTNGVLQQNGNNNIGCDGDKLDISNNEAEGDQKKFSKVKPTDDLFTSKADGCVKIRDSFEVNEEPITVPVLLQQLADDCGDYSALAYRKNEEWEMVNFREYNATVRTTAKAFLKLGLERYKSVCILGANSPEWFYSDLGAIVAGGFAVGIYATNSAEACLYNLETSSANIVVVENDAQLQKILKIKDRVSTLKAIIQYSGSPTDPSVYSWSDIMKMGENESDDELNNIIDTLAANECCTILFTSGTTSAPKAVMLSHDNMIFTAKVATKNIAMQLGCDRIMSYLPLSHAAAQICDLYAGLCAAACIYFADKTVLKGGMVDNLKSIRPTIMFGVPRVWEKIKEGLQAYERTLKGLKYYIATKAKDTAFSYHRARSNGKQVSEPINYKIFRIIFFSKVKESLGLNKCRVLLSGAAPLSMEVKDFFTSYDMPIGEGYGMTESCASHIVAQPNHINPNYCGKTVPGMRTKIDKPNENGEGEICLFGRHIFMGYLNDPEKTAEATDAEGWLYSGDMGVRNEESFIRITGRIKDILITAGGENIAPILIEQTVITKIPIVSHAVLVADGRKYVSLLITLKSKINPETGEPLDELEPEVKSWCKSLGCPCETVSEILQQKPSAIYEEIQRGIDKVNEEAFSAAQRIQKFTILPKDFSIATGELGPTTKLLRRVVYKKYEEEIEEMYAG